MNKDRLMALTDGIIAIAATIMVLQLALPNQGDWESIVSEWTVFVSYIISFALIYLVWYMHHNLFQQAKTVSRATFLINGLWIFFLTLVPYITNWIGHMPDSTMANFFYPLDLLLWSLSFHWMTHQVRKDNPGIPVSSRWQIESVVLYTGYGLSMILAFLLPYASLAVVGVVSIVLGIRIAVSRSHDVSL